MDYVGITIRATHAEELVARLSKWFGNPRGYNGNLSQKEKYVTYVVDEQGRICHCWYVDDIASYNFNQALEKLGVLVGNATHFMDVRLDGNIASAYLPLDQLPIILHKDNKIAEALEGLSASDLFKLLQLSNTGKKEILRAAMEMKGEKQDSMKYIGFVTYSKNAAQLVSLLTKLFNNPHGYKGNTTERTMYILYRVNSKGDIDYCGHVNGNTYEDFYNSCHCSKDDVCRVYSVLAPDDENSWPEAFKASMHIVRLRSMLTCKERFSVFASSATTSIPKVTYQGPKVPDIINPFNPTNNEDQLQRKDRPVTGRDERVGCTVRSRGCRPAVAVGHLGHQAVVKAG